MMWLGMLIHPKYLYDPLRMWYAASGRAGWRHHVQVNGLTISGADLSAGCSSPRRIFTIPSRASIVEIFITDLLLCLSNCQASVGFSNRFQNASFFHWALTKTNIMYKMCSYWVLLRTGRAWTVLELLFVQCANKLLVAGACLQSFLPSQLGPCLWLCTETGEVRHQEFPPVLHSSTGKCPHATTAVRR